MPRTEIEFGQYYYDHDCGEPYRRSEHWLSFFQAIADRVVEDLAPRSVLDAGCAWGMLVEAFRKREVEAWGVDVSEYAIDHVHDTVAAFCRRASLTEPLPRRYDLVTCIEVLEHMPSGEADAAIGNLCAASDRILFSSSPYDYGEATHVNVRPPEEWAANFARHGFVRDLDFDASFLTAWAVLYERSGARVPEIVRSYERAVSKLTAEAQQVRQTVLDLQGRLEGLGGATADENVRLREDLLATRDAVIGHEASLGEALGRVEALEAEVRRHEAVAHEVDLLLWSRTGRLLRLYHRLRGDLGGR